MKRDSKRRQQRADASERARDWELTRRWNPVPFPALAVDATNGDQEMVRTVRGIATEFDLRNDKCRQGVPEMYFKLIREYDVAKWQDQFRELLSVHAKSDAEREDLVLHQLFATLHAPGKWLFDRLPEHYKRGSLMRHFFYVAFDGKAFVVQFRLMDTVQSPGGKLYLPSGRQCIQLAGHTWQLAFHGHALERLCERARTTPVMTYFQYTSLWTVLDKNLWIYEPLTLNDGQQGVRVLQEIDASQDVSRWYDVYVRQLLGWSKPPTEQQKLRIVLGYLPVEVGGRYARAVTFLFPGFRNTPEHKLVDRLPVNAPMRHRIEAISRQANFHSLFYRKTAEAIKWFHDNGVPQVFPIDS